MALVRDIPLPKAVQMVREKIEGVMEGGPDGLRRAFRVFVESWLDATADRIHSTIFW